MTIKEQIYGKGSSRLAVLGIVFIITLVYANSLMNLFVWDDYLVIVNNNFIKSWQNLPAVFSKVYLSPFVKKGCCFFVDSGIGSGETSYRPAVTLSYFLDYSAWKLNAFGYHLTNLFLHITNALLLYFLINSLLKNRKAAFLGALLFALHPVNSEVVNLPSFREDLLSFLFYLASFISYIKLRDSPRPKVFLLYAFSLLSFALALFSKEMAVTLPIILITYDYFFTCPDKPPTVFGRPISYYLGYICVLLFYVWVRFFVMVNVSEPPAEFVGGDFYTNILTMSRVIATYIKWIFIPVGIPAIMPNEPYLISVSLFSPPVLFSLGLIAVSFVAAVRLRKTSKVASFATLWFFLTLLPVANILPIPNYIASRYLYIPLAGFCLLIALYLAKSNSSKAVTGVVIAALIFYSAASFRKNFSWRNNTVFHLGLVKRFPHNALGHAGLGDCFKEKGLSDKAINEYKIAIRLNPELLEAYNKLGIVCGEIGRYDDAVAYFKQALKIDPNNLGVYNNLAITYARIKNWPQARENWEKALKINPAFKESRDNLNKLKEFGF